MALAFKLTLRQSLLLSFPDCYLVVVGFEKMASLHGLLYP